MNLNVELIIPELKDYWYQEKIQKDPQTMSYNAGYNVSYYGYHYNTGCIDFPREKWEEMYAKRKSENNYFAYIKNKDTKKYVGYCSYNYNNKKNRYECSILIEYKYRHKGYAKIALEKLCDVAKNNGINKLYDNFEINRKNTLDLFKSIGFKIEKEEIWKKFNKDVEGIVVSKDLR